MLANVAKWSNSLALRIPSAFAREIGLREGTSVDISVTDGMLVVRPVEDHHVYDLDALLNGITGENRYSELASGEVVGKEF